MMNYEIFKEVVKEKFMKYLSPELRNGVLEIHEVNKVNRTMDALCVRNEESNISPNIYLNELYEQYVKSDNLNEVLSGAATRYMDAITQEPVDIPTMDMESLKERTIMVLANSEQNKEMLANIPNKPFQDLSVIFRWVVSQDENGIGSCIITNSMAEQAGITAEELFQAAIENTKEMFPAKVTSMEDVMREMFAADGMDPSMLAMMGLDMERDPKESMWVITNERGINGSASMLYEENLHKLSEKIGTDLYILPSSIHEVIAVSVEMGDPKELSQMVQEINQGQVALEERLSNNVYHYDKDLRKLTLATDVPNKRLDGVVAEPPMIYENEQKR